MKIKMMKKHAKSSLFGAVPDKYISAGKIHRLSREDLKKLASGYQEPQDLSEVCRRGLERLRDAVLPKMNLEVNFSAPGPVVKADAYHIQQILIKLATNTREDADHGTIRLSVNTVLRADIPSTHRLPLDWQPKSKLYACLEIAVESIGIEAKNIHKLFDQFYTCNLNGVDLCLLSVLEVVQAHRGALTVETKAGCGYTFRIFLPVSGEEVTQPASVVTEAPEIREGGTMLVVDDDPMLRCLVRTALMSMGFTVLEAMDGLEAVALFRQHQNAIRFVLCDVVMPHMDGWETLAALRQLAPGIPVILSSGYDLKQVMTGDHAEMPQVFLEKPSGVTELRAAIRQALKEEVFSDYIEEGQTEPDEALSVASYYECNRF